jgi:hypothetical protein
MDTEIWPDWPTHDVPALARYVSPDALDDTGLSLPRRYVRPEPGTGMKLAREVYESIRGAKLRYSNEPWRRGPAGESLPSARGSFESQRIRYAAWVMRHSCGTCLDLAVLYASALLRADIRPYIAIAYGTRIRGEGVGHAFVLADLRAPLGDQRPGQSIPGFVQQRQGELRADDCFAGWPADVVPVDPMYATVDEGLDFASSVGRAMSYVVAGDQVPDLWLCDVVTAQGNEEYRPLGRPADTESPAIWTRLPEMPHPRAYPSRAAKRDTVMSARGRPIVIYGPQGIGKSMLAYERARNADSGYGWFLNASDQSSLRGELAQAEVNQRRRAYPGMDMTDREGLADAARERLDTSGAPWVLVLDNANCDPGEIRHLLPRGPRPNQTIIVTTTHPAWLGFWPDAAEVTLSELDPGDMADLPANLSGASRSPLVYEAARAAITSGAGIPETIEQGPGLAVQLGMAALTACDGSPRAVDLAHLVAWAPPVPLPVSAFADVDPGGELAAKLGEVGLVTYRTRGEPTIAMHRLIAERIRGDHRTIEAPGHGPVPAPVALLLSQVRQELLIDIGDTPTLAVLERFFAPPAPRDIAPRTWGLAVHGIARAGELRGRSEQSSELYERAIGYLDEDRDPALLSECWNGRARYTKDHPPAPPDRAGALAEAVEWAGHAENLAHQAAEASTSNEERDWHLIRAERARAMRALIMRKQAADIVDPAARKAALNEVLGILVDSADLRQRILGRCGIDDHPDLDRSRFNIGGTAVELAKLSAGEQAEGFLKQGHEAYAYAKQMRVRRFDGRAASSIASCDFGLALILYYGALLAVDPLRPDGADFAHISREVRMSLLRGATVSAWDSLRDRSVISIGSLDDKDVFKSHNLMTKIIVVRKILTAYHQSGPVDPATAEAALDEPANEALREATASGDLVRRRQRRWLLPADPAVVTAFDADAAASNAKPVLDNLAVVLEGAYVDEQAVVVAVQIPAGAAEGFLAGETRRALGLGEGQHLNLPPGGPVRGPDRSMIMVGGQDPQPCSHPLCGLSFGHVPGCPMADK